MTIFGQYLLLNVFIFPQDVLAASSLRKWHSSLIRKKKGANVAAFERIQRELGILSVEEFLERFNGTIFKLKEL
jgi:hypothetical protein